MAAQESADGIGRLTAVEFQGRGGVEDWRVLAAGVSAWFAASTHAAGAALIRRVVELVGSTDRLPRMDLRAGGVRISLGDSAGPARADVQLARAISAAAADLGLTADPSALQSLRIAFDALDKAAVMPFWRAVLGYQPLGEDDLVDPLRRDPAIWFQHSDQQRPLRNRIHLDIVRPQAVTVDGLEAAKAAGGRARYVGEYYATIADAEGNEADIIPLGGAGAGTAEEVGKAVDRLGEGPQTADWRVLFGAMTFYPIASPVRAAELVAVVAVLADDAGFPLLVDVHSDGVTIDTGKDQWEDQRFPALARQIQAAARDMEVTADPTRLRFVQVGIDAVDIPAVRAFWRAILGYEYDPRPHVTDIYDPRRLNRPVFFQEMPAAEQDRRKQRNRIHIDVFVPHDQAQARISTALAEGGRIVNDERAPAWWTLADSEGNEVDIAVSAGGGET